MSEKTSARGLLRPSIYLHVLGAALAVMLAAAAANAQSDAAGTTPSGLAPGALAGSYPLSGFESINLFNGNLNFHLPLLSVSGRGEARHAPTLKIDQTWTVITNFNDQTNTYTYSPEPNWWEGIRAGYGPGVLQARHGGSGSLRCGTSMTGFFNIATKTLTRLTFTTSDGTEYELRDQQTNGQPQPKTCSNYNTQYNRGKIFVTADGTSATFISDADITDRARFAGQEGLVTRHSGYLMLRDGTRYRIDDGTVTWARDRNGNLISFAYDANKRVTSITDSLGRQVTVAYDQAEGGQYGTCDRISFGGFGGAQRILRVCKTSLGGAMRATQPSDVTTPQTYKALFPELDGSNVTAYNPTVVSSVWLPDGQRRYQFFYNQYGELARAVLPTGGAIEYDYTGGFVGGSASGAFGPARNKHIYRRAVERRVYANGSNLEGRTTYSRPESMSGTTYTGSVGYVTTEQFDPAGTRQTFEQHYFNGTVHGSFSISAVHYASWLDGREYKMEAFDSAGAAVLRRVENTWRQRAPVSWWDSTQGPEPANDPRLVTTVTTIEPGGANLVTKVTAVDPADSTGQTVGFDQYNNQTDSWVYDYGAGAPGVLLRRAHTDYVTAAAYVNADLNPALGASLRGLPSQQWVSTDAAGANKASLATYAYDQFGLTDRPGITGICTYHPNGVCSATGPNNESSAAYTTRGNVTSVTRYANAANATGAAASSSRYDIAGNVVSTTDANGNISTASFADAFCNDGVRCGGTYTPNTYAYPTGTISPVPDPTGQYGSTSPLTTSAVYDYYTGRTYSSTDANAKTAAFEYNDPMDRLTKVTRPDGGRTTYTYVDAHQCGPYVETRTLLDTSGRESDSYQFFDGLGRPYLSEMKDNQDPGNPWLRVDTRYDALGRAWQVSNPYRSPGCGAAVNPSGRWTQTTFDGLGRATQVKTTAYDAAVTTAYSGNSVTVTDQAGKGRKSVTDALGRLTSVYEDPAGLNYLTSYTYDALGNLRKVDQGGQIRFFMYDSLGRLVRARNVEHATGTATSNVTDPLTGNGQWSMAYGYDANGNLTSRIDARNITTSYAYDALNRNTLVSYSDGTPGVRRIYDTAQNGLGRYRADWTWDGAGTYYTHRAIDHYDAVGRPLDQRQYVYVNNAAGNAFTTSRTYDLAGNVLTQTYPSGHTVSYNYDIAGRFGDNGTQPAFSGNLGDGSARSYASEVRYQEMGGREQERYGAATPVYNKHLYNARGQLAEIRVSTYSITSPGQETNWNRGAIINHYSDSGWGATGGGPDNNGNLKKQDLYIPDDDAISGYGLSTFFYNYDPLNRLYQAREVRGGQNQWVQYFDYDRWGNRTVNANNSWGGAPEPQFTVDAYTNRLGVPAGQAGVMSYDAAGNLTNDTYQAGLGGGGTRSYDAENRIRQAQFVSGQLQTASYAYDADGRRVKRNAGAAGEVWQVYGIGGELLADYGASALPAQPQKEYGYRGGELLVTAQPASAVTSAGLVGYWKLDEGAGAAAADSSASGNSGSLQGGTAWAAGKVNGAAVFDGADDYVQVGAQSSLNMTTAATFSAWIQPTGTGSGGGAGGIIVAKEGEYEVARFGDGTIQWAFANSNPGWTWVNTGYVAPANQWTHVVVTYSDGVVKTYANGQLVHTYTGSGNIADVDPSQNDFRIGGRQCCSQYFQGRLDEVRVYNRALTAGEVADVAGASAGGGVRWLISDQLGTPRMVLDQTGSLAGVTRHDYFPFGEELPGDATWRTTLRGYGVGDGVKQKFTSKERDADTGLDYFGARYYSSSMGRWSSPDWSEVPEPIPYADLSNPQSLNLYVYVYNNPLSARDPDGHKPEWLQKLINKLTGNGWKTDAEVKAEKQAEETRRAQEAARDAEALQRMGFDPTQISQLSNQQVIDFYNALQRGETSVTSEGREIRVEILVSAPWKSVTPSRPLKKMGHAAKHLGDFQKIDPSLTETDVAKILDYVRSIAKPTPTSFGGKAFEAVVDIGGKPTLVKVVESAGGVIKTGYPVL